MTADEWEREIEVEGRVYRVIFIKRPFREGLEARVDTSEGVISVAELGLGEQALLERVKSLINPARGISEKNPASFIFEKNE